MSETGPIDIPLICLPKVTEVEILQDVIDFEKVIMGETRKETLRLKNKGALGSKFQIKDSSGEPLPTFSEHSNTIASDMKSYISQEHEEQQFIPKGDKTEEVSDLELFCKQLKFNKTGFIEGYSETAIHFTFAPTVLKEYSENFLIVFDNEDQEPKVITIKGECMNVPIYVEQEVYDFQVCIYDHTYRNKIILKNRSAHPMKIQLYSPKEVKGYMEFNPTLGYI